MTNDEINATCGFYMMVACSIGGPLLFYFAGLYDVREGLRMRTERPAKCCYECGKPLCAGCRNKQMLCGGCYVLKNDVVHEYFKEKYADALKI